MLKLSMQTACLVTILANCVTGCGKKKTTTADAYGKVSVQMTNNTPTALATTAKPDTLKVRLMYFMVGNFNETTSSWAGGQAFKVYYYPTCVTTTTSGSGTNDSFITSYSTTLDDAACLAKMEADASGGYLDLALGTTAVNTAINAQKSQVPAGTYSHFELALLGAQQGGHNTFENMSWTHSSVAGTESYALKKTEYIVKFPTPMTLKTGDSVVATVNYDLSAAIQIGAEAASGDNIDCVNDNTANKTQTCATMPALTIGVTAATK